MLGGCDWCTKCGREEIPHIRGQEQWPRVPGCDGARTAERSYPSPRSGAEAGRSYPTPPHLRLGAVAGRTNPMPEARVSGQEDQVQWLHRCRRP